MQKDNTPGKVLLITGPAAGGKTTLAESVAQMPGWVMMSEDEYWARHGWHGHRTEAQEATVQKEVTEDLRLLIHGGTNVALEFILYKTPPNPLTEYVGWLRGTSIAFDVVVLKPSVETVVQRMLQRARPDDLADLENRKKYAVDQIACLSDPSIDPSWLLDTTTMTSTETFAKVMARL